MRLPVLLGLLYVMLSCSQSDSTTGNSTTADSVNITQNTGQEVPRQIRLQQVADNLTAPLLAVSPPDNSGRLFVIDQIGLIYIIEGGQRQQEPFLDITSKILELKPEHEERGLLGLTFHPQFSRNGRFFVYYSAPLRPGAPNGWDHTTHVSEFTLSAATENKADLETERIIMRVDQPQSNHNAGMIAFGPDSYLYIALGDGGGADDTDKGHVPDWYNRNDGGNGQDIEQNLLGSILRIDVDAKQPYAIPEDNPFAGDKVGMDEIWAYGLRNPYRFSFDRGGNNQLFAADAGQELWEEVNIIEKGGNYGWNVKEGTTCFNASEHKNPLPECPNEDKLGNKLLDPIITFRNSKDTTALGKGLVIVGGYVYRGPSLQGLQGSYLFGAWTQKHHHAQGAIFAATQGEGSWQMQELKTAGRPNNELGHYLLGFGEDQQGEVYVLVSDKAGPTGNTGKVYRVVQ